MQQKPSIIISVIAEAIGLEGSNAVKSFPMFSGPGIIFYHKSPRALYI